MPAAEETNDSNILSNLLRAVDGNAGIDVGNRRPVDEFAAVYNSAQSAEKCPWHML